MLDHLIKGATVVDGTGAPPFVGDVGVRDGRVISVTASADGGITDVAASTIEGAGLVLTPGFVDPHTHYDAQFFWDPYATPSNVHGVTSVVAGNCGFTLAPLRARDAEYLRRMMAKVEGMPLPALESGVPWDWETFPDYLNRLDGSIGVNAGFMVGHCALRRYVMGDDAVGSEASAAQIDEMVQLLHEAIEAGGLGFSTTLSRTHSDGDGKPVASRWATRDELVALCAATGEHPGTSLEAAFSGGLDQFSDEEIDTIAAMVGAAKRTLNWNVLTIDSSVPERVPRQLGAAAAAEAAGGRVVALTMPVIVPMNMNFGTFCSFHLMPGWNDVISPALPLEERIANLRDPATQRWMVERSHSEEAGVFRRLADWPNYYIGDTFSAANEGLKGRKVADIAAERGQEAFATLVQIAVNDDLRTILWPGAPDNDPASWELRRDTWADPRAMLGGSDAGAHLDRMCGAPYTTRFLADTLRGRKLVPLERAVQLITSEPARLFGLVDRGTIAVGSHADLVLFDPDTVGSDDASLVADLPGGSVRLTASSHGIERVFVNGVETVSGGTATGATPGSVLRSGADTRF